MAADHIKMVRERKAPGSSWCICSKDKRERATKAVPPQIAQRFGEAPLKSVSSGSPKFDMHGREPDLLPRIMKVDLLLDDRVADKADIREIDQLPRDSYLEWPQPELALPRRPPRVNLVKRCQPPAPQLSAQLSREPKQAKGNAAPSGSRN